MEKPAQVTFHNLPHSDAMESDVRTRLDRLDEIYDRLISARVVIDSPHRGKEKGKTYAVRIELGIPGNDIVVNREPIGDLQGAMSDAFDTAKKLLRDQNQRRR